MKRPQRLLLPLALLALLLPSGARSEDTSQLAARQQRWVKGASENRLRSSPFSNVNVRVDLLLPIWAWP